ncbi:hypothetical protein CVS40_0076 [Lucilia cuprina]|nr:hypothetical protein CVS40_0076 [Lucilia cuprina]
MLTTTTQQYLNTYLKEHKYLSTALTGKFYNKQPTAASNASVGLYERLAVMPNACAAATLSKATSST